MPKYAQVADVVATVTTQNLIALTNEGSIIGYVNLASGYSAGATSIKFAGFSVTPADGSQFKFGGHEQRYTISAVTSDTATISPALKAKVDDNEQITLLGQIDSTVFNTVSEEVDEIIDAYVLLQLTSVDWSTPPRFLVNIAARMVRYHLYDRHNMLTPDISAAYDNDMALLEKIRTGKLKLGTEAATKEQASMITNKTSTDRKFTDAILDTM